MIYVANRCEQPQNIRAERCVNTSVGPNQTQHVEGVEMAEAHPICSIENCGKPAKARGYCAAHWRRWRLHGHPLGGGTPDGAPMAFLEAAISSDTDDCILWPFSCGSGGYAKVYFNQKMREAHRLVCQRVHGDPPDPSYHAAHDNNGVPCAGRHCINPRHLRWASALENHADREAHGTSGKGRRGSRAKLTASNVEQIRQLRGSEIQGDIARRFGVGRETIGRIHRNESWVRSK